MQTLAKKRNQNGVVLWISLMVLVVLLAAAVAIVRNTSLGQGIAGNLGFKKNATFAGDQGTEAARAWLATQNKITLQNDIVAQGYYSSWGTDFDDPTTFSWTNAVESTSNNGTGNQVSYLVHRMCRFTGPTNGAGSGSAGIPQECVYASKAPHDTTSGSQAAVSPAAITNPFYRVTSRVVGPRNTVSYVQTMLY